jgi:hypothetical protein
MGETMLFCIALPLVIFAAIAGAMAIVEQMHFAWIGGFIGALLTLIAILLDYLKFINGIFVFVAALTALCLIIHFASELQEKYNKK